MDSLIFKVLGYMRCCIEDVGDIQILKSLQIGCVSFIAWIHRKTTQIISSCLFHFISVYILVFLEDEYMSNVNAYFEAERDIYL